MSFLHGILSPRRCANKPASRPLRVGNRIGLFDPSPGPSGPSRYVTSILSSLDPAEFEPTVFCVIEGPHQAVPGVRLVYLSGHGCRGPVPPDGESRESETLFIRRQFRSNWRGFMPSPVKL